MKYRPDLDPLAKGLESSEQINTSTKIYTIGDDVITQSEYDGSSTTTEYLLYDGHGSTRQLIDPTNSIVDTFSYNGYGVLLQDGDNFKPIGSQESGHTPDQATDLLCCCEYFDTDMQQYYLRLRWYKPANGKFNRMNPFAGNNSGPQSLHKYLYCNANPVNATDIAGFLASFGQVMIASAIIGFTFGAVAGLIKGVIQKKSFKETLMMMALCGAIGGLALPAIVATIWWLVLGVAGTVLYESVLGSDFCLFTVRIVFWRRLQVYFSK